MVLKGHGRQRSMRQWQLAGWQYWAIITTMAIGIVVIVVTIGRSAAWPGLGWWWAGGKVEFVPRSWHWPNSGLLSLCPRRGDSDQPSDQLDNPPTPHNCFHFLICQESVLQLAEKISIFAATQHLAMFVHKRRKWRPVTHFWAKLCSAKMIVLLRLLLM